MRCDLSRRHGQPRRAGLRALWWQCTNTAEQGGNGAAKGVLLGKTQGILKLLLTYKPPHQSSPLSRDNGVLSSAFTNRQRPGRQSLQGTAFPESASSLDVGVRSSSCFSSSSGVEMSDFYAGAGWKQRGHGSCGPTRWRRAAALTEPLADLRPWISYRIWNFMGCLGRRGEELVSMCSHR